MFKKFLIISAMATLLPTTSKAYYNNVGFDPATLLAPLIVGVMGGVVVFKSLQESEKNIRCYTTEVPAYIPSEQRHVMVEKMICEEND